MTEPWTNKLYFGDNLGIMREYIPDESVDLIYLDPPFNSNATYNVLFKEKDGNQSAAQIEAFGDTWGWGLESEEAFREIVTGGQKQLADLIQALRSFLGTNDMMAYLVMMAQRLIEMQRVLKSTGSIYLHCDPTASHYLKLVMDAVFGAGNFVNEIIWQKIRTKKAQTIGFGSVHDIIFFYKKAQKSLFCPQLKEFKSEYIASHYKEEPGTGRLYRTVSLLQDGQGPKRRFGDRILEPPTGKHWVWSQERIDDAMQKGLIRFTSRGRPEKIQYLDEMAGDIVDDLWTDIPPINSQAKERLGYPTQKPEALLERIIKASSNEGDIVMDPFCGCGTAIAVAEQLNRRWIGIDLTHLALNLMKHRLQDTFGEDLRPYEVIGDPKDLQGAGALAKEDRYQFEWWALGKVAARPAQDKKKGADSGIDGYINFIDDKSGKAKTIIVQVKSGGVKRSDIATLKGDLEREKAAIGAFITLEEPTKPMKEEAAAAGFYEPEYFPGQRYPKIQIRTIEELLGGKQLEYPRVAPEITFKRAERKRKKQAEQEELF